MLKGGPLLKTFRQARAMTQSYIAGCHGVSLKTYQRWENELTPVPFDDLVWILDDIIKIPLSEALRIIEDENNQRRSA